MRFQDRDKYSLYEYTVAMDDDYPQWVYTIHREKDYLGRNDDIDSSEYFDTRECAVFGAEMHIDRLENGEN